MKPFIKPRTTAPVPPVPAPQQAKVSPNELTVLAVACAISEPAERSAYLDRVCAEDPVLRAKVEKRMAERAEKAEPTRSTPATIQRAELMHAATRGQGGGAVAIVPMPDMQMSPVGQRPVKHSAFPWLLATLLAGAVGALAVIFSNEKAARAVADNQAQSALAARQTAEAERDTALTSALEAKTVATRTDEKRAEAERQRTDSDTKKAAAELEWQKAKEDAKRLQAAADAAKIELDQSRKQLTEVQKASRLELAGVLGKFAFTLVEEGRYGEAEAPARQAMELHASQDPNGWPTLEARFVLGSAMMAKGDVTAAEKELLASIAGMEALLPQGAEPERAKYATAVKKLAQLYTATGKRREASEWRKKLEAPR